MDGGTDRGGGDGRMDLGREGGWESGRDQGEKGVRVGGKGPGMHSQMRQLAIWSKFSLWSLLATLNPPFTCFPPSLPPSLSLFRAPVLLRECQWGKCQWAAAPAVRPQCCGDCGARRHSRGDG